MFIKALYLQSTICIFSICIVFCTLFPSLRCSNKLESLTRQLLYRPSCKPVLRNYVSINNDYCIAFILMGKRELIALLNFSSCCLEVAVWLFLAVPWVCLQFVLVVFPHHTQLLFLLLLVPCGFFFTLAMRFSVCSWSCYLSSLVLISLRRKNLGV